MQEEFTCQRCGAPFERKRDNGKPQVYCSAECRKKRVPHPRPSAIQRFWSHVEIRGDDDCWPWLGSRSGNGYGNFSYDTPTGRKQSTASNFILGWIEGRPLEDGEKACHTCDQPPCCNPSHLFRGTQKDNLTDASAKHRLVGNRGVLIGARNPAVKLTAAQVVQMKELLQTKGRPPYREIAVMFGVSCQLVAKISQGRIWKHTGAGEIAGSHPQP